MRGDRGDIILGWLTRIAIVLSLVGVVGFDLVSVAVATMNASDLASAAAVEGADVWVATHDVQKAYGAALSYAEDHGATIKPEDFSVTPDGVAHVTIHRTATTIVLNRAGATKKWTEVEGSGSGRSA